MKYVIKYRVQGFEGEQMAGPYEALWIATEHFNDIRGFEGVSDCRIEEVDG